MLCSGPARRPYLHLSRGLAAPLHSLPYSGTRPLSRAARRSTHPRCSCQPGSGPVCPGAQMPGLQRSAGRGHSASTGMLGGSASPSPPPQSSTDAGTRSAVAHQNLARTWMAQPSLPNPNPISTGLASPPCLRCLLCSASPTLPAPPPPSTFAQPRPQPRPPRSASTASTATSPTDTRHA